MGDHVQVQQVDATRVRFRLGMGEHRFVDVTVVGDMLVLQGGEPISLTPMGYDRVSVAVAR